MAKRQEQGVFKEFKLTSLAVDYPTSVLVLMVIIVLSGLASYAAIPARVDPRGHDPQHRGQHCLSGRRADGTSRR